jgi:hypothetical protein
MVLRDIGKMKLVVQVVYEGLSFSTHFLVNGPNWIWRGLKLLLLFFHLVDSFWFTNWYGGGLGMLMCKLVNFTHIMITEWGIIKPVRRMITIFTRLMRYMSVRRLGVGMPSCHELVCPLL